MRQYFTTGIAIAGLMMMGSAQADLINIEADVQYWSANASGDHTFGDLRFTGNDWDTEGQTRLSASFEHFLPLIPNIKVTSQTLEFDGKRDQVLSSRIDLSNDLFTLYYAPLNNDLTTVHFGASYMRLSGSVSEFGSGSRSPSESVSEDIGLGYLRASLGLPFTGFSVVGQGQFSLGSDHDISDLEAAIRYRFMDTVLDGHVSLGYRQAQIKLANGDYLATDYRFKGPFLSLSLRF